MAIFPFAVSAMYIIDTKFNDQEKLNDKEKPRRQKNRSKVRNLTISGFIYLLAVVTVIVVTNVYELAGPTKLFNGTTTISSVAMHCTKNMTMFNVTHLSQCGKFTPGSIAEECASNPNLYDLDLRQCSDLLDNS